MRYQIKNTATVITSALIYVLVALLAGGGLVYAQTHSSTNYSINEVFIGAGGNNDLNSASYNARVTAGETAVGNPSSANYQLYAGFETSDSEYLAVAITGSTSFTLGELTSGATLSTSTTFEVRNYLSHGYSVQLIGDGPTNGSYSLSSVNPRAAAATGVEQFGVNLRANSTPAVGADPVQVPDGTFSYGVPAADYNVVDEYKYLAGDTIASSPVSTGFTEYTLSLIMNAHPTQTPGGVYTGRIIMLTCTTF